MKLALSLVFAAGAVAVAAPASAQFAKPEDAVKYRQSSLFVMGQHFGRIGAMANGKAPYDPKATVESAEIVATMSKLPWPGFAAGTEKITPTRAKPELWSEPAKFKEKQENLMVETTKLVAAAKTNNLENVKTSFAATAKTCKSCHDDYRKEQQ